MVLILISENNQLWGHTGCAEKCFSEESELQTPTTSLPTHVKEDKGGGGEGLLLSGKCSIYKEQLCPHHSSLHLSTHSTLHLFYILTEKDGKTYNYHTDQLHFKFMITNVKLTLSTG